jgi:hypothetical protein
MLGVDPLSGAWPRPAQDRRKLPVDATAPNCQGHPMLGEPEKQFSLTRAALSTDERCKKASPISPISPIRPMKPAKLQATKSTIRFSAKLFRPKATEKVGSWTLLTLPRNASAKLPSRSMTMVEGTINGFPFRAALEPNGNGSHWLRLNQALHDAAGADPGDIVTVEITRAGEEPETRVPMELRQALAAAPRAQALWSDITPMARQNWILWISSAKLPKTRLRWIENACDMLAYGKKRVCCFGGLKWLMKYHPTSSEGWLRLPN